LSAYYAYFGGDASLEERRQFFEVFAQMWAEHYDQRVLCQRVADDEHAIALFRVDKTLRQLKEFREAFNCRVGDNMVNARACRVYG
jgi:endothelin-converting enzyme/putative endopeptidase